MERKSMIKVRGGFSDRVGIDPCNTQMQIDDFDERTRTFISNKLYDFLQVTFNHECETRNIKYGPTDQNLSNIYEYNISFSIKELAPRDHPRENEKLLHFDTIDCVHNLYRPKQSFIGIFSHCRF